MQLSSLSKCRILSCPKRNLILAVITYFFSFSRLWQPLICLLSTFHLKRTINIYLFPHGFSHVLWCLYNTHLHRSMDQYFFSFPGWTVMHSTANILSNLSSADRYLGGFTYLLLWIMLHWALTYICLCGCLHIFNAFGYIPRSVIARSHLIPHCFKGLSNCFSKVAIPLHIPTSNVWLL